ncbi:MAG: NAD-binding protein, partial [Pseudomonadota bacterium]
LTLLLAQGSEFAFVVFQTAAGAHVFSAQTASILIACVALSMLLSPFLLIAIDRWLLPRFAACPIGKPQLEELSSPQSAPIILAGFGRYGQIIGRMLLAQGIRCTVLEHDADMIETARTFGYTVFYGDATRLDLLRTAGAAHAKIIIVAVDDPTQSLEIVDLVKAHFPHLQIVARARDVTHWGDLRDRGVTHVQRELFESSLRSARTVLELLGHSTQATQRNAARFRQHNIALFEQLYPHRKDRKKFILMSKKGRQDLEEQMAQERQQQGNS